MIWTERAQEVLDTVKDWSRYTAHVINPAPMENLAALVADMAKELDRLKEAED